MSDTFYTQAAITFPHRDNEGNSLIGVIAKLESDLLDFADGFTRTDGHGAWRDKSVTPHKDYVENVAVWRVFVKNMDAATVKARLGEIAASVARLGRQECVMIEVQGMPYFIDPAPS